MRRKFTAANTRATSNGHPILPIAWAVGPPTFDIWCPGPVRDRIPKEYNLLV
jgi:hypothetical protein